MARKNHAEHARVTAICVNLALDGVEADIRQELDSISGEQARTLLRVLEKLKDRRVKSDVVICAGRC
jgi:hypothetical protein